MRKLIHQQPMETLLYLYDFVFHLDRHLYELANFPLWLVYAFFFTIVFVETGLVVMPFLPGDSFLFIVGTFVALNIAGGGNADILTVNILLIVAAVLGDGVNYHIGKYIGPRAFHFEDSRWFNKKALIAAHDFYVKHGGKTIIIARFMPFIRTFAPFVAGMGTMPYSRFILFNVVGAVLWVSGFSLAGYFFGQLEFVQKYFSKLILVIILISITPLIYAWVKHKLAKKESI